MHLQVEVGAGAPRPSAVSAEMVFGNLWAGDVQSLVLNLCIIASAGWGPWGNSWPWDRLGRLEFEQADESLMRAGRAAGEGKENPAHTRTYTNSALTADRSPRPLPHTARPPQPPRRRAGPGRSWHVRARTQPGFHCRCRPRRLQCAAAGHCGTDTFTTTDSAQFASPAPRPPPPPLAFLPTNSLYSLFLIHFAG